MEINKNEIAEQSASDGCMAENSTKQIFDELCLFDDTFMSKVFQNNIEGTQLLVSIILGRDDLKIISSIGQRELKSPEFGGRNITLDILADDSNGNKYNIEVQRASDGADVRRARFHSSALNARMVKESEKFKDIRESYVIFITEKDKLKKGLPLYHVERVVLETGELWGDGSHIIYVNGSYDNMDTPIGRLMHDFRCTRADDVVYNVIAKQIRYFKETEGGQKDMGELLERYAEQRRLDAHYNDIKNAMESLECTMEQAMDVIKLSETDRAALSKRF